MINKPFALIFGGIGLIPLLIALGFAINTALFISQSAVAIGEVIQAAPPGATYKSFATIRFTTDAGQEVTFNSSVRSSPPEFRLGQRVKVYYNPSNPSGSAQADSFISQWFFSGLFGIIGLAFFAIGVGFAIPWILAVRKKNWLYKNGQRVTAIITGLLINKSVSSMGKHPYIIKAQWHDPYNIPFAFKSESIWQLPTSVNPGDPIGVLIDPQNPRRYHVEVTPELSRK